MWFILLHFSSHLLGAFTLSWPHLPVDTTLSGFGDTSHMYIGLPVVQYPSPTKSSTVVVAEGIPPVSCRLVEKVRKWEYVNLADLLEDHNSGYLGFHMSVNGPYSLFVCASYFISCSVHVRFASVTFIDCKWRWGCRHF